MIDYINTLKNIHKAFPKLSTQDIITILDCIQDYYNTYTISPESYPKITYDNSTTEKATNLKWETFCSSNSILEH